MYSEGTNAPLPPLLAPRLGRRDSSGPRPSGLNDLKAACLATLNLIDKLDASWTDKTSSSGTISETYDVDTIEQTSAPIALAVQHLERACEWLTSKGQEEAEAAISKSEHKRRALETVKRCCDVLSSVGSGNSLADFKKLTKAYGSGQMDAALFHSRLEGFVSILPGGVNELFKNLLPLVPEHLREPLQSIQALLQKSPWHHALKDAQEAAEAAHAKSSTIVSPRKKNGPPRAILLNESDVLIMGIHGIGKHMDFGDTGVSWDGSVRPLGRLFRLQKAVS